MYVMDENFPIIIKKTTKPVMRNEISSIKNKKKTPVVSEMG